PRSVVVTASQPRLELREDLRLETGFEINHSRRVVERAPFSELSRSDGKKVHRAGTGFRHVNIMAAIESDADIPGIGRSRGCGPVVLLKHATPVMIIDSKETPFAVIFLSRLDLSRDGRVTEASFHPPPAVHLEYSTRRKRADQRVIDLWLVMDEVESVEAAHDVCEYEGSEQPLVHAITLDHSDGRILGGDFTSILKLEAADAHAARLAGKQVLHANEDLLGEDHSDVAFSVVSDEVSGSHA